MTTPSPISTPIPAATSPEAPTLHELAAVAAQAADDKKGLDTVILDVGDALSITEAFVITSATNRRQVAMLADEIESAVKAAGGRGPVSVEGLGENSWVLLDFGGFVAHVFLDETRKFYDLERLWRDVPRLPWTPLTGPGSASGAPVAADPEWSHLPDDEPDGDLADDPADEPADDDLDSD